MNSFLICRKRQQPEKKLLWHVRESQGEALWTKKSALELWNVAEHCVVVSAEISVKCASSLMMFNEAYMNIFISNGYP